VQDYETKEVTMESCRVFRLLPRQPVFLAPRWPTDLAADVRLVGVFRDTWRRLPPGVRRRLLAYWRTDPYQRHTRTVFSPFFEAVQSMAEFEEEDSDSLAAGSNPAWIFQARCVTLTNFPKFTFSRPTDGRFELLVDTPHGLLGGNELEFEVTATGPAGAVLTARFRGRVQELEEPRKVASEAPGAAHRRKPPYKLKVVTEAEWDSKTCWGEKEWTAEDVGCYEEPTDSEPLTLIINEDHRLLKNFREDSAKRLDEATVRRRVNEFQAHVYFHLYQQYKAVLAARRQAEQGLEVREPNEEEFQQEINRVGTTLLRLMA
jgi:hypothetical protein